MNDDDLPALRNAAERGGKDEWRLYASALVRLLREVYPLACDDVRWRTTCPGSERAPAIAKDRDVLNRIGREIRSRET